MASIRPERRRFGQVNLRDVAGDDGFGIEAEPREEHFHLFAGGVLGFVQNDEGIVERAAAHEGQRRNFDDAFFEKTFEFVGFEEVVERVVKRAHVGINFFLQRAGKKSEAFAGFDGGTRENDAIHLLREQRGDGHGHGEIRFASAAGADGENHVVGFESFDVALLVRALGDDGLFAERARVRGRERAAGGLRRLAGGDAQQRFHFLAVWRAAVADALVIFAEDLGGAFDLRGGTFNFQIVIAEMRGDVESGFEKLQIFVESAEEFVDATSQADGLFHQVSRKRYLQDKNSTLLQLA